jgi:hypothetical protein
MVDAISGKKKKGDPREGRRLGREKREGSRAGLIMGDTVRVLQ